ncbi:MAG: PAS domain S-box protein, partial [Syntrophobacteraceae bacterium]
SVIENMEDVFYRTNERGEIVMASPSGARMLGYDSIGEMQGKPVESFWMYPDERKEMLRAIREDGVVRDYEITLKKKDGSPIFTSITSAFRKDDQGNILGVEGIIRDITDRTKHMREIEHLSRLYSVLSRVSQAVVRAKSPETFLEHACREIVEGGGFLLCWIGQVELITNAVVPKAFWGGISEYVRGITVYADNRPEGRGPTGTCIRESRSSVHNDFLNAPQTFPWRDRAAPFGIASCAAFPIEREGRVWGALSIYSDEVDRFSDDDVKLLEKVAGDIEFALDNLDREFRRKLAEEALRLRESYQTAILENQPGLVWLKDKESRFLAVNHAFARSCGMERPEEVLGKTDQDIWPRELAEKYRNDDKAVLTKGAPIALEETICDQGEIKWFETFKTPVLNEDGQILGTSGYARDITERKNAEKALHESELRLRTILQTVNEGFWLIDNNTVTMDLNPRMCAIMDRNREGVLGRKIFDFVDNENKDIFEQQVKLRAQGQPGAYEIAISRPDGSNAFCQFNVTPFFDGTGNKVGAFAMVTDISERKQAQDALRESETKLQAIFNTVGTGVFIIDRDTQEIIEANQTAAEMTGLPKERIIGQICHLLVCPAEVGKCPVKDLGQKVDNSERKLLHAAGQSKDILKTVYPVTINGRDCYVESFIDITDRKRAAAEKEKLEAQLFQAQKMESVGRLAGGVAHDFNNMLGVIIGRAEMALERDIPTDKLQENLHEILKAGLRSADLTRQLLAFARKQTATPKILDLNETISGMLKMLRRLIGEDIDLSWIPELDLWKVKIDPSQVDQILANLLVNARDAIPEIGVITLRTENVVIDDYIRAETPEFIPGEYILLTVSDNGTGMSQEVRENIFEPFFTTKELGKGTGLGLSTVYGIVKQNDGFIYVASELGKGTTFKIYLPRFEAETAQVPSEEITIERRKGTETILLVEDDEAILDLSKIILEKLGYTVFAAQTPVYAIHLAEEHSGDLHLLITDLVMPEMNGRELAKQISASRPNLKCLYMSGYTADIITHRGLLDDGVDFIQKPFGSDELAAKVRQVLDHLK